MRSWPFPEAEHHRETLIESIILQDKLAASSKWHLKAFVKAAFLSYDIAVWQTGLHNVFGSMTNENVKDYKEKTVKNDGPCS